MLHPQAVRGEEVACDCGMPNKPGTHFVSACTRYRHRKEMGLAGNNNTRDTTNTATTDNEGNGYEDDGDDFGDGNHMDVDVTRNDLFKQRMFTVGCRSESDRSATPSSTGSWLNVPTPPPSPPPTPPPGSDDEEQPSEDKDGFMPITEDDYCEYECCQGVVRTDFAVDEHSSNEED
ncbi:hypothetical protein V565_193740 [Rhizoctonia solani 123E]|uniref:Uncharacterized protein n=1 Tax=Rhizoctonia solani 123E TaxID=1423351 RepID=A0A074RIB9_9AGAM|nr:hypothetical protein V565_193740 [Rhizoctonia solani 123E]